MCPCEVASGWDKGCYTSRVSRRSRSPRPGRTAPHRGAGNRRCSRTTGASSGQRLWRRRTRRRHNFVEFIWSCWIIFLITLLPPTDQLHARRNLPPTGPQCLLRLPRGHRPLRVHLQEDRDTRLRNAMVDLRVHRNYRNPFQFGECYVESNKTMRDNTTDVESLMCKCVEQYTGEFCTKQKEGAIWCEIGVEDQGRASFEFRSFQGFPLIFKNSKNYTFFGKN
ncbi:hypothetical protein L596_024613 [Steinernema carpocapsae]|uniref:Uncharacterized protein n=1 Tax=Steinernema carpocapsae TaxID=34508 RepID=A0A4V5ZYK6_STECR|nr:hypothetical protein L596_024613 [Steinernema carpocapsae]